MKSHKYIFVVIVGLVVLLLLVVFVGMRMTKEKMQGNNNAQKKDLAPSHENGAKGVERLNSKDVVTHVYRDDELLEIANYQGSLEDLNARYPVECLRQNNLEKYVVYYSDTMIGLVYFDENDISFLSRAITPRFKSTEFDFLSSGDALSTVIGFDPDGDYPFLHTGVRIIKQSMHYTTDGYVVLIQYDEDNVIASISKKLI